MAYIVNENQIGYNLTKPYSIYDILFAKKKKIKPNLYISTTRLAPLATLLSANSKRIHPNGTEGVEDLHWPLLLSGRDCCGGGNSGGLYILGHFYQLRVQFVLNFVCVLMCFRFGKTAKVTAKLRYLTSQFCLLKKKCKRKIGLNN